MSKAKKGTDVTTNDRLEFAKAISNMVSKQEAFQQAVEKLGEFREDTLKRLDMELDERKLQMEELSKQIERARKDGQIETDQVLAEYKYQGALRFLGEVGEVAISSEELERLRGRVVELEAGQEEELERVRTEERGQAKKELAIVTRSKELEHQAGIATLNATVEQQQKEIENLHSTIESLKHEITAQRELTREVAMASRQAPITQTIGKT